MAGNTTGQYVATTAASGLTIAGVDEGMNAAFACPATDLTAQLTTLVKKTASIPEVTVFRVATAGTPYDAVSRTVAMKTGTNDPAVTGLPAEIDII